MNKMKASAFGQKGVIYFNKALTTFWKMFLLLKQLFDAKMFIKRLPSFNVPKFTVIQQI